MLLHDDPPPVYPNVFACIILSSMDMLRIYGFSEPVKQAIDATISRFWTRGVQEQGAREETWQWKLRGAFIRPSHLGFRSFMKFWQGSHGMANATKPYRAFRSHPTYRPG
jgi:hypothetical protein